MVAPIAGAMKYSIQDTAVALGLMANSGIKGSMSGRQLRGVLSSLSKPASDAAKAIMNDLGLSLTNTDGSMKSLMEVMGDLREGFGKLDEAQQITAATTLVGRESMAGLLAVVNASDEDFNNLAKAIYNSNGAASEMRDIMDDTLHGKWELFMSQVEGVGLKFAEVLVPSVKDGLTTLSNLMEKIGNLDSSTLEMAFTIGKTSIASGVLFKVFGKGTSVLADVLSGNNKLIKAFDILGKSLGLSKLAMGGMFGAITIGVPVLIGAIDWISKADERLAKHNKELTDSVIKGREEIRQTDDLIKQYEETSENLKVLPPDSTEYTQQKEKLIELQQELVRVMPESAKLFDEEGNAIEDATDALKEMNKEKAKKLRNESMSFFTDKKNKFDELPNKLKDYERTIKVVKDLNAEMDELSKLNPDDLVGEGVNRGKVGDKLKGKKHNLNNATKQLQEYETFFEQINTHAEVLRESGQPIPKWIQDTLNESRKLGESMKYLDEYEGKVDEFTVHISKKTIDDLKLDDDMRMVIENMESSLKTGSLSMEDFNKSIQLYLGQQSLDFGGLTSEVDNAMQLFMLQLSKGEISMDQFKNATSIMSMLSSEQFRNLDDASRTHMTNLLTELGNGNIGVDEFAINLISELTNGEVKLQSLAGVSTEKIGELVNNFLSGKMSAQELGLAFDMLAQDATADISWLTNGAIGKLSELYGKFQEGGMSANELKRKIGEAMGWSESEISSFVNNSNPRIQEAINKFTSGKSSAQEFARAINGIPDVKKVRVEYEELIKKRVTMYDPQGYSPMNGKVTPSKASLDIPDETPIPYSLNKERTVQAENKVNVEENTSYSVTRNTPTPYKTTEVNDKLRATTRKKEYSFSNYDSSAYKDKEQSEEDLQRKREQLENDANSAIEKSRNELYRALKNKIEKQKADELSLYDAKIAKIKEEIELLQDDTEEKTKNLEKMREELALWEKQAKTDNYAKVQADKLKEQIADIEKELKLKDLQNQIADIEKEKEKVEKDYEVKLSDEFLYNEANQMILRGNMDEMLNLIKSFNPDFSDIGMLFGKTLAQAIKEGLTEGLDGFNYLKQNGYTGSSSRSGYLLSSDSEISTYSDIVPINDFLPNFSSFSNIKGLGSSKTENKTISVVNHIKIDGSKTNEPIGQKIGSDISSVIFNEARRNGYNRTLSR
ncbi:TPA: phage tail tape measure protein [Clostridium perfringens]